MSTQINVTVGSGGLSEKAKQLQAAARQAQLEKERQQRIEVQGQEQRTANLAAAGRAPDGSPLYGPGFKQAEIQRRPAAFRFSGDEIATAFIRFPRFTSAPQLSDSTFVLQTADKSVTITEPNAFPPQGVLPRYRNLQVTLDGKPRYWDVNNPSDPNYIPLPISWTGTVSGEITNFNQANTLYATQPRVIALPAGKQNFILYISDQTFDCNCKATWSATGSASVFVDKNNIRRLNTTQVVTPEAIELFDVVTKVEYCWIVGPKSIRAIAVPPLFKSVILSVAADRNVSPTYAADPDSPESSVWLEESAYPESGTYNFWGGNYHFWGLYLVNQTDTPSPSYPLTGPWFDNVYTWGLAMAASPNRLNSYTGTGSALWVTPAIFSLLQDPAKVRSDYLASGNAYNFQHVATTLLGSVPTPTSYRGFVRLSDTEARFDKTSVLPLDHFDYSNATPLTANKKGKVPVLLPSEDFTDLKMIYCWDWGNASYCRQQLISLGFASSDLTP